MKREPESTSVTSPPMLDFNDIETGYAAPMNRDTEREAIRAVLLGRLESDLFTLYPAGRVRRGKFTIGDISGSPGDSLEIVISGEKAGLWTDRENGNGGDVFHLIASYYRIEVHEDFAQVLRFAAELVGRTAHLPAKPARETKKEPPVDELGKATAKWD